MEPVLESKWGNVLQRWWNLFLQSNGQSDISVEHQKCSWYHIKNLQQSRDNHLIGRPEAECDFSLLPEYSWWCPLPATQRWSGWPDTARSGQEETWSDEIERGLLLLFLSVTIFSLSLVTYRCIFNHRSLDDRIHNGNYPSVWASMELAVQDSNVSFGSVTGWNLFSLSIHEIKKCILHQECCSSNARILWVLYH